MPTIPCQKKSGWTSSTNENAPYSFVQHIEADRINTLLVNDHEAVVLLVANAQLVFHGDDLLNAIISEGLEENLRRRANKKRIITDSFSCNHFLTLFGGIVEESRIHLPIFSIKKQKKTSKYLCLLIFQGNVEDHDKSVVR
jgi:hypothetical protein